MLFAVALPVVVFAGLSLRGLLALDRNKRGDGLPEYRIALRPARPPRPSLPARSARARVGHGRSPAPSRLGA